MWIIAPQSPDLSDPQKTPADGIPLLVESEREHIIHALESPDPLLAATEVFTFLKSSRRSTIHNMTWIPPEAQHLESMLPQYGEVSILGYGGMGAVYQAVQSSLRRLVAIKILPSEIARADPTFVDRFETEAQSLALMQHTNIVTVHDFGATRDGQLYIVMEFVEGSDVASMIQPQKGIASKYVVPIITDVCRALEHAHNHGIVHHDIKPANVLVRIDGIVKVVDFWLAKIAHEWTMGTKEICLGTPDFVAPEALIPGIIPDHRGDLYSLGVMFYQMLTGVIPRHGHFSPSVLVEDLDPRYDALIEKAMMENPDHRYQSAREFRKALELIRSPPK
jgi:serine/threonine protein kinase